MLLCRKSIKVLEYLKVNVISRLYRVHKSEYFMEFIFSMSEYEKAVIYESTPTMNGMGCMVKNLTFYFVHGYGGVWWGADCSHGGTHDLLEKHVIVLEMIVG